jgi:hypothetical protein
MKTQNKAFFLAVFPALFASLLFILVTACAVPVSSLSASDSSGGGSDISAVVAASGTFPSSTADGGSFVSGAQKSALASPSVAVGVSVDLGSSRSVAGDSAVTSILIGVKNANGNQVGTGYLTGSGTGGWTGSVTVHDTGLLTFSAAALNAQYAELYYGEAQTTVTAGGSSVTIGVELLAGAKPVVAYYSNGATSGWAPMDGGASSSRTSAVACDNVNGLYRTGYYFTGWNTASDGSGANYPVGSTVSLSGSGVALYACWVSSSDMVIAGKSVMSLSSSFSGELMIPPGITTVRSLGKASALTAVYLSSSVTSVDSSAFDADTGLARVNVGDSAASMSFISFTGCASLKAFSVYESNAVYSCLDGLLLNKAGTKLVRAPNGLDSVSVPAGVTTIGQYAFFRSNASSVTLPSSLSVIEYYAFCYSKLPSFETTNSLTSIGGDAFLGCPLTSVSIPSVSEMGGSVFESCTLLTSVSIGANLAAVPTDAFNGCTSLSSVSLPPSVLSIGDRAFYGCTALLSFSIPASVTTLGASVFSGCKFTAIEIPASVKSIGQQAFYECFYLTSITLPAVTDLGGSAFYRCVNMTSATVESSLVAVPESAFYGCVALTSVSLPSSVLSIGQGAFYNCSNLASFSFPESLTSIGTNAFLSCAKLEEITVPSSVTDVGSSAFYNCTGLKKATINGPIKAITDSLFGNCASLASVTLPPTVISIGFNAFNQCVFTSFTIPDAVKSIGSYAFSSCANLTGIAIPANVISLGPNIFSGCTALAAVTVEPTAPPILGSGGFTGCSSSLAISVPSASLSLYQSASNWSTYKTKMSGY